MMRATEKPEEHKECRRLFEARERRFFPYNSLRKRRKKVLLPGEGLYFDNEVNQRWMSWQACWDYLRA